MRSRAGAAAAVLLCVVLAISGSLADPRPPAAHSQAGLPGPLYRDGPGGRYLLGGSWMLRTDPANRGVAERWYRTAATAGWRQVTVPNAWNAGDNSASSMAGGVAWYRRDFSVPGIAAGTSWLVRFESVNNRATVWLNGRRIGGHTGAYLPFELRLRGLRRGLNRLVVRTDSHRRPTDFPPAIQQASGGPRGGWWNYGGILREVYLRRVDLVDIQSVGVTPVLRCPRCAADVSFRVLLRSYAARALPVRLSGRFGGARVRFPAVTVPAGGRRTLAASIRVAHPSLWSPGHPALYPVTLLAAESARGGAARPLASYSLWTGIRSITVQGGRLLLNGHPVQFRGVGIQEDNPVRGAALTAADIRSLVARVRALGATVIRAHYPLSPYLYELADRYGILVWSEIPVYRLPSQTLDRAGVRRAAVRLLERNIAANANHPSIFTWSIGNELGTRPSAGERSYIAAAVAAAHRLDPTRPATIAFAGRPRAGCPSAYAPLPLLGVNDYFGWYGGEVARQSSLGPYLDHLRSCYPRKALAVSEFGAEANRPGPATQKGTYAFQRRFAGYHLAAFRTRPWLSGAIYWTLESFRADPGWTGGNPRPDPPWHQKGLMTAAGAPKPAFYAVRSAYRATPQYGRAGAR